MQAQKQSSCKIITKRLNSPYEHIKQAVSEAQAGAEAVSQPTSPVLQALQGAGFRAIESSKEGSMIRQKRYYAPLHWRNIAAWLAIAILTGSCVGLVIWVTKQ